MLFFPLINAKMPKIVGFLIAILCNHQSKFGTHSHGFWWNFLGFCVIQFLRLHARCHGNRLQRFFPENDKKIKEKLHIWTFIQPKLDYISSKYVSIEQIQIIMFLKKNKYSSVIIPLVVLLAANGRWGIQVFESPIFRHFKGLIVILRGQSDISAYNNKLEKDHKYNELKRHVWEVTSFWP